MGNFWFFEVRRAHVWAQAGTKEEPSLSGGETLIGSFSGGGPDNSTAVPANSIRQELFAVAIMSVIAHTLMVLTSQVHGPSKAEFQFKTAVMTLTAEAAVLVPDDPDKAVEIFSELLAAIARVRYYRPKSHRPSLARITKRPPNKWCSGRRKKMENS